MGQTIEEFMSHFLHLLYFFSIHVSIGFHEGSMNYAGRSTDTIFLTVSRSVEEWLEASSDSSSLEQLSMEGDCS